MTSAQVVETSVNVTPNSPSQDYTHPGGSHNLRTYDMTPVISVKVKIESIKLITFTFSPSKYMVIELFFLTDCFFVEYQDIQHWHCSKSLHF